MKRISLFFFISFLSIYSDASPPYSSYLDCFKAASDRYNVDLYLLLAIAKTESNFDKKAINTSNRNGTSDYGLMQVNSSWFNELKQFGITAKDVKENYCVNVNVGAWILSKNFDSHGTNWNSVGAYNAGFKKTHTHHSLRKKYALKVYNNYVNLKPN